MPEKKYSEISREVRELYAKGNAALQRDNLDYAIAIFTEILRKEPGFFDCREALRATQIKKHGSSTGFFKKFAGTAASSPLIAKGQMTVRGNPVEALHIAEQILSSDPHNSSGHKLLAEAALGAELPRTAVASLEFLRRNSPKDQDVALRLADAYTFVGQSAKGEAIFQELLRANPRDGGLATAYKNFSARRTLNEQGYEKLADGQGSYRDVLKDKTETVSLEQEKRQVKSEDVTARLISEYEARLKTEPNNLRLMRDIAELYTQKKEFDRALEYYGRVTATEGATDATLEKAIAETSVKKFNHLLSLLDKQAPDYAEQLARIEAERTTFMLADAQLRAEKYPTDLSIRFELGVLFFQAGKVTEAIQEFQKAQNNPHKRIASLSYLGQCFFRRGMNDLAAKTLQNAIKEKLPFDDEKKELIYLLGSVLEKAGKGEEAIDQFKQIYEVDIGYKDVSAKIDKYYGAN